MPPEEPGEVGNDVSIPYRSRFLHLTALWAFGVSQPVFAMLKGNPEFLVVRGSTRLDVVAFALLLAFGIPTLLVGLQLGAALAWRTLAGALHVAMFWCAATLAALQLLRLLDVGSGWSLLLPIVPATLATAAYLRLAAFRSVLALSAVLPVIGVVAFVSSVPLTVDDARGATIAVPRSTPVVLVIFDELPVSSLLRADGAIDAERYPSFGRLSRTSTWYPLTTGAHVSSTRAVPAILTGKLPLRGTVPTLANHPDNLFTLLGERYELRVFEQVTRLCPTRYCPRTRAAVSVADRQRGLFYDVGVGYLHRILPSSLRGGLPPIGQRWGGFGDGSRIDARELVLGALDKNAWNFALAQARGLETAQFESFLGSFRVGDRPRTLFVEHALMPHSPWHFLPSGRSYGDQAMEEIEPSFIHWKRSGRLVNQALQRHLLQVGYTDRLLGRVLNRLETTGLLDRALVVVTADHGASFRPGGYFREVSAENVGDIASVPLFVKYPGQRRGRIDKRHARTIDVVPTIADVLGLQLPWPVDGASLRQRPLERPVTIGTFPGGTVEVDPGIVERQVAATTLRNVRLFGEGKESLYRIGPHDEVVGKDATELNHATLIAAPAHLDNAEQFSEVRQGSVFVPSRIKGTLQGAFRVGTPLAIAVNGRIAATTWSFALGRRARFAALVPESVFRPGRNTVDVFVVTDTSGRKGGRPKRL